jgi:hypothetical protein
MTKFFQHIAIVHDVLTFDGLVKSPKILHSVIPAKAGIQRFRGPLDAGSSPA